MYLEFYGLNEAPFSITPDPRFVYLSERHRDALAHLLYGISQGGGGGFVQLTGEVGTGKTTISRLLLEQLPAQTQVALILNPHLSPIELLETICEELHLDIEGRRGSRKRLLDVLNAHLLRAYAEGQRVVLIIDEAQELSRAALEQVRMLTNLETSTQKLLQIVLLGQPELRTLLDRPELRQLAQRITARYHLTPLDAAETEAYLRHRLAVAGSRVFPFTRLAVRKIHARSGGVPRLINVIADRALLAGYARGVTRIGEVLVERAAGETVSQRLRRLTPAPALSVAVLVLALAAGIFWWLPKRVPPSAEPAQQAATASERVVPQVDASELGSRIAAAGPSLLLAFNRLLSLWSLRADRVDVVRASQCPPVLAAGVFCLHSEANLSKLASLGRPVVLHLRDGARDAWALLQGVDALRARIWLAGTSITVERLALEARWNGEFIAIWRAPDYVLLPMRIGDSGPAIDWLHTRLALPAAERSGPSRFDENTQIAVKRLQARHGLLADGIVGPETLLAVIADQAIGPQLATHLEGAAP